MYCEFFGFKEQPFTITPNPRFIFLSKSHREAFAHLLYGIESHAGFIELTGEVGSGKTTILRSLLNQLDDTKHRTALIFNPRLSADELLRTINREFGILATGTIDELMYALNQFLLQQNASSRTVVLVIDESQNLDPAVLEQIRMISNLETDTAKLIQIVLAGQPELGKMLESDNLRQLNQRIKVRYHLPPLDFEDMVSYIDHRLEIAGGWKAATFTGGALKKIYKYSSGLPRLINVLCDRTLLIGFTEESREISGKTVSQAIRELKREQTASFSTSFLWKTVVAAFITLALVAIGYFAGKYMNPAANQPLAVPIAEKTQNSPLPVNIAALLSKEIANLSEMECAIRSFNIMAGLWGLRPVVEYQGKTVKRGLELLAARRGMRLLSLTDAKPEDIAQADAPCLLELKIAGTDKNFLFALTGIKDMNFILVSPASKKSLSMSEIELKNCWTGLAYVPWSNHFNLPDSIQPGNNAASVRKLQQMLAKASILSGKPSGIFDATTIEAVRKFQAGKLLKTDGMPGPRTLMLLYRSSGETTSPNLTGKGRI